MRVGCSHTDKPKASCPTKNQQDFAMNGVSVFPPKTQLIENKNGIKCGFWNILADGLAYGEFISKNRRFVYNTMG